MNFTLNTINDTLLPLGYSPASDMFAFGVVMGELLMNMRGPRLQSPADVDKAMAEGQLPPEVTEEHTRVLKALLDGDPAKRPSAAELLLLPMFSPAQRTVLRECAGTPQSAARPLFLPQPSPATCRPPFSRPTKRRC